MSSLSRSYQIAARDYARAGEASADIKRSLRQLGVPSDVLRRASVAAYEAEMNLIIHSLGGSLTMEIEEGGLVLITQDQGPGIQDLNQAMQEGWSTAGDDARDLGFGAGMGLPNMKRNADSFEIQSVPGEGTRIRMWFALRP